MQKVVTCLPSRHRRTTLSGYVFGTKAHIDNRKKLVKQQYLLHMSHNMVDVSPLAAEIGLVVWGTPANFNGFRVLAALLQRRRSTEANQTLQGVWPSPALVRNIYIFGDCCPIIGDCCPITEFCQVQSSVCILHLALSYFGSVTAQRLSSGRAPHFAALSTGRHLYSAGRPSCSELAHILVDVTEQLAKYGE